MTVAWILNVLECGRMLPRSVGMKKMTLMGGETVLRNPCRLARLNEGEMGTPASSCYKDITRLALAPIKPSSLKEV